MLYLIVTSLPGAFAWQILTRPIPHCASHVLQMPSWQSYCGARAGGGEKAGASAARHRGRKFWGWQ